MIEYKMVCCDVDGTLLKNDKSISQTTKQIVKQVQAKGVPFILASGRSYEGVQKVWKELDTTGYSICYNGNMVLNHDTVIYRHGFHMDDIKEFLEILSRYRIEGFLCTATHDYLAESLYRTLKQGEDDWVRNPVMLADNQYDCLYEVNDMVYKISLHIEDVQLAQKLSESIHHLPLYLLQAETGYYDIMMKGHQKGDGVEFLSKHLQVDRKHIICIGDNENDISMISYAGLGVAMGNATENVKKHADFIGESNEFDGVAKLLQAFIL